MYLFKIYSRIAANVVCFLSDGKRHKFSLLQMSNKAKATFYKFYKLYNNKFYNFIKHVHIGVMWVNKMNLGELSTLLTIEEKDIHRTALEYLGKMICWAFDSLSFVINHVNFAICN